jgi:hypothetical protein
MAYIEQWDSQALGKLLQRGSMAVREIMESVERDQFELAIAEAWVESALERLHREDGRLERVDSLQHHRRWAQRGGRSDRTLRCQ